MMPNLETTIYLSCSTLFQLRWLCISAHLLVVRGISQALGDALGHVEIGGIWRGGRVAGAEPHRRRCGPPVVEPH